MQPAMPRLRLPREFALFFPTPGPAIPLCSMHSGRGNRERDGEPQHSASRSSSNGRRNGNGDWSRPIATASGAIAILLGIHSQVFRPAFIAEMRTIADERAAEQYDRHDVIRQEQIQEVRRTQEQMRAMIARLEARLDQFDDGISEHLRSLRSQVAEFGRQLKEGK